MLKILFLELTKTSVNHQTQLLIHFHKQETIQQEHHFNHSKKIYQRLQMAKNYPGRQYVNLKETKELTSNPGIFLKSKLQNKPFDF